MITRRLGFTGAVALAMAVFLPMAGFAESSFYDQLSSPDVAVRRKAIEDFKGFPPDVQQRLMPDIMVATRDDNPDVQQAAESLLKGLQASKPASDADMTGDLKKETASGQDVKQSDMLKEIQNSKQDSFPDMKSALDEEKKHRTA